VIKNIITLKYSLIHSLVYILIYFFSSRIFYHNIFSLVRFLNFTKLQYVTNICILRRLHYRTNVSILLVYSWFKPKKSDYCRTAIHLVGRLELVRFLTFSLPPSTSYFCSFFAFSYFQVALFSPLCAVFCFFVANSAAIHLVRFYILRTNERMRKWNVNETSNIIRE